LAQVGGEGNVVGVGENVEDLPGDVALDAAQNFAVGLPLLAPAAIDAVRQWKYRPYLLNGAPLEVETTVTVSFTLAD